MHVPQPGGARSSRIKVLLAAILCTAAIVLFTSPENTGDAADYARDVASADSPIAPRLLESGHVLWRPAGVVIRNLTRHAASTSRAAARDAQRQLTGLSVASFFVAAASIGLFVLGVVGSVSAAVGAVFMTALGAAVINFGQAGAPYIPGLALVSLALWLGTAGGRPATTRRNALAGALLGLGVMVWLPYILVVPAVIAAIYFLSAGDARARLRAAGIATAACGLLGIGTSLAAARANDVSTLPAFAHWISRASHGIARPGLTRVIIGLPRSFVHMGTDGREVRRYLVGDRLNPVSAAQLARLSLWPKLAVFYLALAVIAWFALRRPGGRVLLLLLVLAAAPAIALGATWSGGEEERYLQLYPFLLLLLAWSVTAGRAEGRRLVPVAAGALGLLWLANLWAFNPWVTRARSLDTQARLGCVAPDLDGRSVIVVSSSSDPLVTFTRDRLDEPPRSSGTLVVYPRPAMLQEGQSWSAFLSALVVRTLDSGGRLWIADDVLASVPPRSMGWVEGAQPVTWPVIRDAFATLGATRRCRDTALLEVVRIPTTP